MHLSEEQFQRFGRNCIMERKSELDKLNTNAVKRSVIESNRYIGLTIIEDIGKNWWFRHDKAMQAFIHDPDNNFSDARKEDEEEDLITTCSWVFQSICDLWTEMQKLIERHHYNIMVKKLFDPREPFLTQKFLFENNILKRF